MPITFAACAVPRRALIAFQSRFLGSVATLQSRRDRLAGCSFWTLRFAVYSNGVNLSRRSFYWRLAGTCAFHFPIVMLRSCWPSADFWLTTLQSGGGSSATPRNWRDVCARDLNRPTTVGAWTKRISG